MIFNMNDKQHSHRLNRENKSKMIKFRVSPEEHKALVEKHTQLGLTLSDYIRVQCLDRKPSRWTQVAANQNDVASPAVLIEVLRQLQRIGNNINQLTKLSHKNSLPPDVKPVLSAHAEQLKRMSEAVIDALDNGD